MTEMADPRRCRAWCKMAVAAGFMTFAWSSAWSQDQTQQAPPIEQASPSADFEELRESIRRLKERVATFGRELADDPSSRAAALAALRAEAVARLDEIAELEEANGIEPAKSMPDPVAAADNQQLKRELDAALEQAAENERLRRLAEEQRVAEQTSAGEKIRQLETMIGVAAAEIGKMKTEQGRAKAAPPAILVRRDPKDAEAIAQATARLEESQSRIRLLSEQGEQREEDLAACMEAKAKAETRVPTPSERMLAELRNENGELRSANDVVERQRAEAMEIASRCVAGVGDKDDRLALALQQIEELQEALRQERAARPASR